MPSLQVSALVILSAVSSQAGERSQSLDVLRNMMGLTSEDLISVDRGVVVAKNLESPDKREVAAAGVAWVPVSKECFVEKFRDIASFKKSSEVLQIGKFSNPVHPRDLDEMTLDPGDVDALRRCRAGTCEVKLPASAIVRLNELNGSAPDYPTRVLTLFRNELLSYVGSYMALGNSALIVYRDKSRPVRLADEFRSLLDESLIGHPSVGDFRDYLEQFPKQLPPNIEAFL